MPALHRLYTFLNQYNASSTSLSTRFKRLQSRRKIPKLTTHRMDSELLSRTALLRNTLLQELVITGLLTSTSFPNLNRYQISSWEKNSPSYQELNVTQKHGGHLYPRARFKADERNNQREFKNISTAQWGEKTPGCASGHQITRLPLNKPVFLNQSQRAQLHFQGKPGFYRFSDRSSCPSLTGSVSQCPNSTLLRGQCDSPKNTLSKVTG